MGGGHKKGHNLVKILLIISNFELDLYFIILNYTEQKWKRDSWIVCHLYTKLCKPRMQMKVYLNVQILGYA